MIFRNAVGVLKTNLTEFKDFAFKGNLIQLAIAVVLGGAFGKLITSFVDNIFLPTLTVFGAKADGGLPGYARWQVRGIHFGQFLADLISFTIIAAAIFLLMVKVVGWIVRLTQRSAATADPAEKECPHCLMKIPARATRCGHCTSDLPPVTLPAIV